MKFIWASVAVGTSCCRGILRDLLTTGGTSRQISRFAWKYLLSLGVGRPENTHSIWAHRDQQLRVFTLCREPQ